MRPLLWVCAGVLAFFIQGARQNMPEASGQPADPLSRWVGSAQEAFGDTLFLKADVYFHSGVRHEDHQDKSSEDLRREGVVEHGREVSGEDWIARINDRVQTHDVKHLTKDERKEMLPFFALSSRLDPRNIEAVLTAAYWLDREFNQTDEAIELLQKGIHDNPDSWEIEDALGKIYFRRRENVLAEEHLRSASRKAVGGALEKFQRADLAYHLAEACLAQGKKDQALEAYREAERYFDEKSTPFLRSSIQDKIKELSAAS